jgi:hypothetical protein
LPTAAISARIRTVSLSLFGRRAMTNANIGANRPKRH